MPKVHADKAVGARQPRNEDRRHLRGKGHFVADISMPRMQEVAFVRSQVAHGRLLGVERPPGAPVFLAEDLAGRAKPIVSVAATPGFKSSDYVLLAHDKVRFVGEPVAMVVAPTRAECEDLAEQVVVDVDPLPAVVDARAALEDGSPLVHDHWDDNRFVTITGDIGEVDGAIASAAVTVRKTYDMGRHCGVPLETRG